MTSVGRPLMPTGRPDASWALLDAQTGQNIHPGTPGLFLILSSLSSHDGYNRTCLKVNQWRQRVLYT